MLFSAGGAGLMQICPPPHACLMRALAFAPELFVENLNKSVHVNSIGGYVERLNQPKPPEREWERQASCRLNRALYFCPI